MTIKRILALGILCTSFVGCSDFLKWAFVKNSDIKIEMQDIRVCRPEYPGRSYDVEFMAGRRDICATISIINRSAAPVTIGRIEAGLEVIRVDSVLQPGATLSTQMEHRVDEDRDFKSTVEVYDDKDMLNYDEIRFRAS